MKRKLGMILALSAVFMMLTACGNNNDGQAELDKDVSITQSTTSAAAEESTQDSSIAEKTNTESTSVETAAITETDTTEPMEYEDIEMPVPFENEDGDLNADFYSTVDLKLDYISMQFINLVDQNEFENWIDNSSSSSSECTSVADLANLYSFVKHFNIPNETVREILVNLRNGSDDDFSDEEIDLMISNDDAAVAEHFAADTAIVKGSDIYSLKWIYYHSPEDYAAAGITKNELEAALNMFAKLNFTDEAEHAIEIKINSYSYSDLTE